MLATCWTEKQASKQPGSLSFLVPGSRSTCHAGAETLDENQGFGSLTPAQKKAMLPISPANTKTDTRATALGFP